MKKRLKIVLIKRMSFKNIEQVKFELNETITWGVEKNKYGSFSISIPADDETKSKIENLVKEHNAKGPLYGRGDNKTLYLKSKNLSVKQKEDLLHKGIMYVKVNFETKGIFTKKGVNHIVFKVTKLVKLDKSSSENSCPPEDSCPED